MTPGAGIEPGTHWWKASALTTAPTLLPKNSIDLLGVTIDKDLSFNRHISQICEKVNKQFSVLKRFKNIITSNAMLRLYKAFILPHFQYCSLIWYFSGTRNCDKLESLNKRILRFIFNDSLSSYDELLKKAKIASLYTGRLHKILMVVFKSFYVSWISKRTIRFS